MCVCLFAQFCPTLCHHMDCSSPDSSVHGVFRQEHWGGKPFPSPGPLPDSGTELTSLELADRFFTTESLGKPRNINYREAK